MRDWERFIKMSGMRTAVKQRDYVGFYINLYTRAGRYTKGDRKLLKYVDDWDAAESVGPVLDMRNQFLDRFRIDLDTPEIGLAVRTFAEGLTISKALVASRTNIDPNHRYVSIDIREANHTVMCMVYNDLPEKWTVAMKAPWSIWCSERGIDPVIYGSRYIRQLAYGRLPYQKSIVKIQKAIISQLWLAMLRPKTVFCSADEIVIPASEYTVEVREYLREAIEKLGDKDNRVGLNTDMIRITRFQIMKRLDGSDASVFPERFVKEYGDERTLVGVPGSRYPLEYCKHILNIFPPYGAQYFEHEGGLASWSI